MTAALEPIATAIQERGKRRYCRAKHRKAEAHSERVAQENLRYCSKSGLYAGQHG